MPRVPTQAELDALPTDADGFRLRGTQMTRIETFTDAAFAFAVTMLVISNQEVPRSYDALVDLLIQTPIFVLSFGLLFLFWLGHHNWSRRFGLEDRASVWLSALLVVVALAYVYPLKFVVSTFYGWLHTITGYEYPKHLAAVQGSQLNEVFAIYGVGFVALALIIAALNRYALSRCEQLALDRREILITRGVIGAWLIYAQVGLLSIVVALFVKAPFPGLPGWVYMILAFAMPRHYRKLDKKLAALEAGEDG